MSKKTDIKRKELRKAGVKLPRRVVRRKIIKMIIPWLRREEIIVITGARQTGKSVLIYQMIYDRILPKTNNIYYFNMDIPKHRNLFEDPDNIIELVKKNRGKTYLFIDEVQRLKEPGLFLKGLYDLHLPLKLIVSGSSALELRSKVHEALTGRKVVFHIAPFDFEELSEAIYGKKYSQIKKDKILFDRVMNHLLVYGGYPAVAMEKRIRIKWQLLKEIFQSYLEKDVKKFLNVENISAFVKLIKLLASQVGGLVNKEELSNSLGIHKNTLDNYLYYLEQTFVLDFVRPFFKNPRKELLKSPKVYFCDLGMRNFAINNFIDFDFRPDRGALFENFSYSCLKNKLDSSISINFWRTKAGAEVDFVIVPGLSPIPFESKATVLKKFKISRSLHSFLEAYKPQKGYCINLSLRGERMVKRIPIQFLTPSDLLNLNIRSARG